jgi:DNA invertase Pin-like site-specific DNA recombinase
MPHEFREAGPVALYARTWPGDPDGSVEVQIRALHEYARRHRLEAVRVYFDTRNTRSQFHEMMAEATGEDPPFRQILVHDMGRLSRWAAGLSALRDRLEANGVTVVSVTGGPAATAS